MQSLKTAWDFFQGEILGMRWLNRLIGSGLGACGLDTAGRIGGSVQFFVYDTVKIMLLLGVLILLISYMYNSLTAWEAYDETRLVADYHKNAV